MCWFSKKKPIKMVAESDIPVMKVLDCGVNGDMRSILYPCKWVADEERITDLGSACNSILSHGYLVNEGFHSCEHISKKRRVFYNTSGNAIFSCLSSSERIYDAVIPAGSEYYLNEFGDYVSNRLKIVGLHKKVSKK